MSPEKRIFCRRVNKNYWRVSKCSLTSILKSSDKIVQSINLNKEMIRNEKARLNIELYSTLQPFTFENDSAVTQDQKNSQLLNMWCFLKSNSTCCELFFIALADFSNSDTTDFMSYLETYYHEESTNSEESVRECSSKEFLQDSFTTHSQEIHDIWNEKSIPSIDLYSTCTGNEASSNPDPAIQHPNDTPGNCNLNFDMSLVKRWFELRTQKSLAESMCSHKKTCCFCSILNKDTSDCVICLLEKAESWVAFHNILNRLLGIEKDVNAPTIEQNYSNETAISASAMDFTLGCKLKDKLNNLLQRVNVLNCKCAKCTNKKRKK